MLLPDVSFLSVRVWQRNRDTFFRLWKSEFWPPLLEPLVLLFGMGVGLSAYISSIQGLSYIQYIAPGLVMASAMYAAGGECTYGTFVRMQHQRTFDAIIATPCSVEDVAIGEILWGATRALLTSLGVLAVMLALGLYRSPFVVATPLVAVATGLTFAAISVLFTSLSPSIYFFNYFFTLYLTPMFVLSGVYFPVVELPPAAQVAAWFLPLTHSVSIARGLATGELGWELMADALWLAAVTLACGLVSLYTMRRRLIR